MPTYQLSDSQISTQMGQESVILNHKKGEYYTLNEVGSEVWGLLSKGPQTFTDLLLGVMEIFEVEETQLSVDLNNLLEELIHEGLVQKMA